MHRLLVLVALLGACDPYVPIAERVDAGTEDWEELPTQQAPNDKVDILFVLDDTAHMAPIIAALKSGFAQLHADLQNVAARGRPASYHIGVVTSDLGAPGIDCPYGLGGRLQRMGLAKTRPPGCQPPVGASYLAFDQRSDRGNRPDGQTIEQTFDCMASVVDPEGTIDGHWGCGFEMPLEAAYRALHDPIVENQGFRQAHAVLAVVFVSNEDDCSADSPEPFSTNAAYGPLGSYRCAHLGWLCDGMRMPDGPQASFAHCEPATAEQGSLLIDLAKYIDFFTRPTRAGGVNDDPTDVILTGLFGPPAPVGTETRSSGAPDDDCGGAPSCTQLRRACDGLGRADIPVAPAERLPAVVTAVRSHILRSTCEPELSTSMSLLADQIEVALRPTCFHRPLVDPTTPSCAVEDRWLDGDVEHARAIRSCTENAAPPCWRLVERPDCAAVCDPHAGAYQRLGIDIDRGGRELPPEARTYIACRVQPITIDPERACQPTTIVDAGADH